MTIPPVFICASWGDEIKYEEDLADAKYLRIPRAAWEEEKRRAKIEKRFKNWNDWLVWASRIDNKRRQLNSPKIVPVTPLLTQLLSLRDEYVRHPEMHFYCERSQQRELKKLEKDIESCVGGIEALKRARARDPVEEDDETVVADNQSVLSSDDEFNMHAFVRVK